MIQALGMPCEEKLRELGHTQTPQLNEENQKNPPVISAFLESDKVIRQHHPNLELKFADNGRNQRNAAGGARTNNLREVF